MQRTWRRAWLRGKPHYMRYKPVRKAHTGSIKAKVYDLTVKAAKKLVPAAAAAGIFLSSLTGVQANPTGGSITAGTGSITGQGTNHVTINQASDKLAVNWNSFSIGSGEKVQFIQPGASSIALNRVLGSNASAIYGQLSANGKVFLLNPNGVLFAQGAQVNVGGLVASTLNLSDQDFMNGKYSFSGDSQQGVLNQGNITVANGGYAALLGANAANEGVILAKEGTVALGAGSKIALDFIGDGLLTLSVDESKVKAEVKNSGLIKADGGLVVMNAKAADTLTGSVVNNTGTIEARSVTSKNGTIILTGDSVTNAGNLDASGKHAGETGGTVKVLGDTVRLAAGAAIDVSGDQGGGTALVGGAYQGGASEYAATKTVVEQGTSINADALTDGNGGQVVVWANDTTSFAGGISAKGGQNSGDGGSVETSGKKTLTVADTASVNTTAAQGKTGNWLLDPADFVVAASGGDITGATVGGWLANNNVTIQTGTDPSSASDGAGQSATGASGTAGNININDTITWASDTTLTLSAYNNIYINRSITNTGAGSLALAYGQKADSSGNTSSYAINAPVNLTAGQHFSTKLGSDGTTKQFTVITSLGSQGSKTGTDLQGMDGNLSGNYFLGADIDASATAAWNLKSSGGYFGFDPIGDDRVIENGVIVKDNYFTGSFDGGGHTISGLTINRYSNSGLFHTTGASSDIRNVGLVDGSVSGSSTVGGLVGLGLGSITNSYNSSSVTGTDLFVGGLVGYQEEGSITNSYNSGNVTGSSVVGGLIGNAYHASITNSYNSGSVSGIGSVGGLAGSNSSSITNSYNSGSVSGSSTVGGLVGYGFSYGSITNSYNSGSVIGSSGSSKVGGLAGYNESKITNSYNSGSVTGDDQVGGLAGSNSSSITNSYNSGSVIGSTAVGGLVGYKQGGSITNSFYATSGSINNGGSTDGGWSGNANGKARELAELQSASFWTTGEGKAWSADMDTVGGADKIWRIYDGHTTPLLKSFLTKTTVNADNVSKTYNGIVYSGTATNVTYAPDTDLTLLLGRENLSYGNARNAGTYGFLYSGQQGYDIVYGSGLLTINKANLTASLTGTVTKTYNGSNSATLKDNYSLVGLFGEDKVNVSGTATYDDKNVGAGKPVTASDLTLSGADAGNYNLTSTIATANIGEITPKTLTPYLTGSVTKTYDGNNSATLAASNYYLSGLVSGDTLTVSGTATYNNKNAGTRKTVTASDLTLGGTGAANYSLASSTATANIGTINKADLTITAAANTKTYDGSTTAAATPTYSGLQADDSLTGLAEVYTDRNAGSGKALQVSSGYTLTDGNNGNNYTVTLVENTSGTINKADLTITAAANTKTYDGTTTAAATPTYSGLQEGDSLTGLVEVYTDQNAGSGKTLQVSSGYTLTDGNNGGNYAVTLEDAAGTIDKRQLAATATAQNKVYDGKTDAAVDSVIFGNLVAGEKLMADYTGGKFSDKNTGDNKTVTISGLTMTAGADTLADNYLLPANVTAQASITPAALTITAAANTKTYDGTTTAAATPTYSGLQAGDRLTDLDEAYTDKNAGSGKTLQVSGGYTLTDGNNGGNYAVTLEDAAGTIDKRQVTATATAQNKVYDGKTDAAVDSVIFGNLVAGEKLMADYTGGKFSDKNAGDNKTVTVSGLTMTAGANTLADNYLLPISVTSNAAITPAALTITAAANTKTYDGTTTATAAPTHSGLQEGDSLTGLVEVYTDKNAGSGKTLQVSSGYTLTDGNNGGNYAVTLEDAAGTIDKRQLAATATAQNKVYDGKTDAAVDSVIFGNLVAGETLTADYTGGIFSDKNAGDNKTVTVSGLTMTAGVNTLEDNYLLPANVTAHVSITPAALAITATENTKTYDGTTTAADKPTYSGLQEGDSLTGLVEVYTDQNAGSGKTLQVSSGYTLTDGNNGNNYTVTLKEAAGTIDKRQLTATAAAQNKVYDGKTDAVVDSVIFDNLVAGETLTADYTGGIFSDKNAGDNKTVTVSGLTMTAGVNTIADNYLLPANVTAHASITPAALTITANNAEKNYDKLAYEGGNDVTFDGFVNGENRDVLNGSLTYGGTAQGATESGTYTITPAGLTSINYTITFKDGTLTIKPAAITDVDPGYIAAVQNSQQSTVHNTAGAGENHAYPPAANAATPQQPAGKASPIQYRSDTAGTPRVITTAGQTVTIAQDSLLQLATNPVQKEVAVYQTISGSSTLAGVYQVEGSQGSLTLRRSGAPFAPVSPAMPAPAAAQAETASFQLTDRQGNTANFTTLYTDGRLYVQAANATAADMLNQNRQLITATSLVAVQDKLGLDINNLQAVYLVK